MFGNGRVKLKGVGDREVCCDKPARAENAQMLSASFFDAAPDENTGKQQPQDRQILALDCSSPFEVGPPTVRIDHGPFHVKIARENHQTCVVAHRTRHQDDTNRRRPSRLRRHRRAFSWQLPKASVNAEKKYTANGRAKAASKDDTSLNGQLMREKKNDPNAGNLARQQGKQATDRSQAINAEAQSGSYEILSLKI